MCYALKSPQIRKLFLNEVRDLISFLSLVIFWCVAEKQAELIMVSPFGKRILIAIDFITTVVKSNTLLLHFLLLLPPWLLPCRTNLYNVKIEIYIVELFLNHVSVKMLKFSSVLSNLAERMNNTRWLCLLKSITISWFQ